MSLSQVKWLSWLMWFTAVSFFSFQFILRIAPGLIMNPVMSKFGVHASDYGYLSSMYYYGYAGAQIPIALLLDRYGPTRVISLSALCCAFATAFFAITQHWEVALVSRFFVGAASAAGFLGTSKVISLYFPAAAYSRMIGLSFTVGLLGALYGGRPVSNLIQLFSWERVYFGTALCCVGVALLTLVLPKPAHRSISTESQPVLGDLRNILKNPAILFLAVSNLLMVGPLEGFADVWGVSYLVKLLQIDKTEAATITSFIFVGMLFGGPLLAYISERFKAEFDVTATSGILMSGLFLFIFLFIDSANSLLLYPIMFIVGILCCYQVIVFSIGTQMVESKYRGMTVAFLNCINMLGGSFFHSSIGVLLDFSWSGQMENQMRSYTLSNYKFGLSIIPISALVGALGVYWVKYQRSKQRLAT